MAVVRDFIMQISFRGLFPDDSAHDMLAVYHYRPVM